MRIKDPFKSKEEKFLTILEQLYSSNTQVPTVEVLITMGAIENQDEYDQYINDPYIQKALIVLGINIDPSIPILTPTQLSTIQIMFNFHDTRSDAKKLRDAGVNGQTWQNWLRDPVFQKFIQEKAEGLFQYNKHEIDKALFDKARSGQVDAIKLYMQLTGKLQEIEKASPQVNVNITKVGNQDSNYFLIKVYEAIEETLASHPDLMKNLANRIRAISNPFMGEELTRNIIPEIEANKIIDAQADLDERMKLQATLIEGKGIKRNAEFVTKRDRNKYTGLTEGL